MLGLISFKNPRFRIAFIVAVSLALVVCIALAGHVFLLASEKATQNKSAFIKAPALVGRDIAKAKKIASSLGLKIEVDQWVTSKVYPMNYVVTQKPLPNQEIRAGGKIVIKVSGGVGFNDRDKTDNQTVAIRENLKPHPSPPIEPIGSFPARVAVIDPGHQGRANLEPEPIGPGAKEKKAKVQGGTTGVSSKRPEYKVTLEISKKLKSALESYGIKVMMIRETNDVNISNAERAKMASKSNADLFIRIHADGDLDANKNGISTLYPALNEWTTSIYEESLKAASIIQESTVKATKHKDNGTVARSDISGFNWSTVPVVLVETGFLTNPQEDALLNDAGYQETLASGIADGVVKYLKATK